MDFGFVASPVSKLSTAIRQEKFSPEILPFQHETVGQLMESVRSQSERLKQIKVAENNKAFVDLQLLELERIKYLLKSYLRTRLHKIETNIFYVVKENLTSLLSEAEFIYAKK